MKNKILVFYLVFMNILIINKLIKLFGMKTFIKSVTAAPVVEHSIGLPYCSVSVQDFTTFVETATG